MPCRLHCKPGPYSPAIKAPFACCSDCGTLCPFAPSRLVILRMDKYLVSAATLRTNGKNRSLIHFGQRSGIWRVGLFIGVVPSRIVRADERPTRVCAFVLRRHVHHICMEEQACARVHLAV